jgi:DNA-binding XRE family transcriptional regulator
MTNTVKIPEESWPTTKLSNEFNIRGRQETYSKKAVSGENVLYSVFESEIVPFAEGLTLDELRQMLSSQDPSFEERVSEARAWANEKLYPEEESLKSLRLMRGLSQSELGEILGTSQAQIAKLESGRIMPRASTVLKLAEALTVDSGQLLKIVVRDHK